MIGMRNNVNTDRPQACNLSLFLCLIVICLSTIDALGPLTAVHVDGDVNDEATATRKNDAVPSTPSAPRRKNILFMLADDGGFEFNVYGNKVTKTPSMSRLAARGTVFDRAYTAVSSCSPSRSAILTGLPTHQNGMYGLHQYPGNFQSNADITSLPNILNAHGYKTGILGKLHVGPWDNYAFQYGMSDAHCWSGASNCTALGGYNNATRNITAMKLHAREFISDIETDKPFFLYVGWGDCHRCGFESDIGSFCENYGSGKPGQETIPDWHPKYYTPDEVQVPDFLPDTPSVREDIAAQYTAVDRMDQGIGLLLNELEAAGVLNDTLVLYFSDNGIPFPAGKTNLYETGQREPLVVSSPDQTSHGGRSKAVVSALDLVPTMLDWAEVPYPKAARAGNKPASLSGASFLTLLDTADRDYERQLQGQEQQQQQQQRRTDLGAWRDVAFGSHHFHSIYCYYPMRSIRDGKYRLILNLAHDLTFGILEDVFVTTTWANLTSMAKAKKPTGWVYDYDSYMHRPAIQLFDNDEDPLNLKNLADDPTYANIVSSLTSQLLEWREETNDPWNPCTNATTAGECSL